jgi:glutathione reductase (NADPH)
VSEAFDLVVLGAGSGGVRAARFAAGFGARVAIIEERFFGGTCVNVGCVPKKLFVYASEFPEQLRLAGDFGYRGTLAGVDWPTLRAAKDSEIGRLNGIYRKLLDGAGVTVFEGHGRITAADTVVVGEQTLKAGHILVATGAQPFVPELPGREHIRISDDLFYLDRLPERVAVVGGGYIACEFAGILHGLGCQVHQLYRRDLILRGFDDDLRHFVADDMSRRGVHLHLNTDVSAIEALEGGGQRLRLEDGSSLDVDEVFYATGRVPNLNGLFADDVTPEQRWNGALSVDDCYQTSIPGIYAIGDVTDRFQLTPVALEEGMWLARHLFGPEEPQPLSYDFIPTAVFCQPNLGTVGLTQAEALERHGPVRVYTSSFRPMRHTLGDSETRSFMKLIVDDATDQVVGLHMAGEEAAEIVQGFAVAINMGATKADFDRTVGIHPTSAEEFVTMREGKVVEP